MFDRKQAKLTAKQNFKKHYLVLVFTCLMAAFLGISVVFCGAVFLLAMLRTVVCSRKIA